MAPARVFAEDGRLSCRACRIGAAGPFLARSDGSKGRSTIMKLRHALFGFAAGAFWRPGRRRRSTWRSCRAIPATDCRFFATCSTSSRRTPATRSPSCRCRPRPPTSSRQYKLWLAAGNADIDVYQTDVIWAPQLADQLRRPDRGGRRRRQATTSPRSSSRRPSTASSSRCRSSPTRRRSTTARTCSTSTARRCRPPGRSWPPPPRRSRTASAPPATRTSGATSARAPPTRA